MLGIDGRSVTTATESCQLARSSLLQRNCLPLLHFQRDPACLTRPHAQHTVQATRTTTFSLFVPLFEQFPKISGHAAVLNNRPDSLFSQNGRTKRLYDKSLKYELTSKGENSFAEFRMIFPPMHFLCYVY